MSFLNHTLSRPWIFILIAVCYSLLPSYAQEGVLFDEPNRKVAPPPIESSFTIYFSKRSALIQKADQKKLQTIAEILQKNPTWEVMVEGHADDTGSLKLDLDLSEKRTMEVERFLRIHFVNEVQIRRLFYGNQKRKQITRSEDDIALQRRVEIKLIQD